MSKKCYASKIPSTIVWTAHEMVSREKALIGGSGDKEAHDKTKLTLHTWN